ncbi:pentapeptide repeat-containing protein [Sphingomonas sp. PvP018]|uniref:pentapeptide repeat-containing protein n=1 Tax=Sphingomonas sp. PvP018 TaxID=2817852 RepID=UPI001AEB48FC|nr:pentapeptide repeat-containing protein [Sphingomonas sp. PvP018]MBP2513784.1 uncharacterized protein YjbI with pentapeptide repeats [Sphingomonas sp. PvP018]
MTDPLLPDLDRDRPLTRSDVMGLMAFDGPVHLSDYDLDAADLSGLELNGWVFERCSMRGANFSGTCLDASSWRSCRGAFADFCGADLTDATIVASDLNNAVMRRSILSSASFERCKLTGVDMSEARAMDARFAETLLIDAKLTGFSFRGRTLTRLDFSQADLRRCDFRASVFDNCSLRDAAMAGSRFEGADLRGADLGGLRLVDAGLFRGATISREQAGQLLGELGLDVR